MLLLQVDKPLGGGCAGDTVSARVWRLIECPTLRVAAARLCGFAAKLQILPFPTRKVEARRALPWVWWIQVEQNTVVGRGELRGQTVSKFTGCTVTDLDY